MDVWTLQVPLKGGISVACLGAKHKCCLGLLRRRGFMLCYRGNLLVKAYSG